MTGNDSHPNSGKYSNIKTICLYGRSDLFQAAYPHLRKSVFVTKVDFEAFSVGLTFKLKITSSIYNVKITLRHRQNHVFCSSRKRLSGIFLYRLWFPSYHNWNFFGFPVVFYKFCFSFWKWYNISRYQTLY